MAASVGASLGVTPGLLANETLDQAINLGQMSAGAMLQEVGSIGGGPAGAADVEWYSFTLDGPARVTGEVMRQGPSSSFNGVLSLFNNDPGDWGDPYDPGGHRLLQQVDGKSDGGVASIDRLLGPGTYYLAVSGDGNFDFHPLLAGSGLPGSTGDFYMRLSVADAGLGSAIGPQVLTSDPAPGAILDTSPLAIRVDLSASLDYWTVIVGETVQLIYSPTGAFDQDGQQVPLNPNDPANFSPMIPPAPLPDGSTPPDPGPDELQLFPASPLAPGYYEVVLDGLNDGSVPALLDASDVNGLGADADHPLGQDITIPFQVAGIDGVAGATGSDDTAATAQNLGDVTSAGLVRVTGAIGVDPFYNPNNTPPPNNPPGSYYVPADQVDMYHFRISGPGSYSFVADVFAGRIGSPLDPGVSLFKLDPATGALTFVAGDNNTYDTALATDGFTEPLFTDSALEVSLTAGDYYLAVANGYNTPSPAEGVPPGSPGLFDLNVPDSGTAAYINPATGPYVLDLHVQPAAVVPPHVVATSPGYRDTLDQPPTQVTVRFDEPVNIALLALQTYQVPNPGNASGIYIEGADGKPYYPRFESYDSQTNEATFLMLDGLPNGQYELHITNEVTDLGGNPLVGNDPSGDYVVPFTVDGPPRGSAGNPLAWIDQEPNNDIQHPQDLGVLFPNELTSVSGVTITRNSSQDPGQAPQDTADVYQFQVLLDRYYTFTLLGNPPPAGVTLSLTDASGNPTSVLSQLDGRLLEGVLAPGTYLLKVSGSSQAQAPNIAYTVSLKFITQNDNAPPLLTGPAPAVAIQLSSAAPPTSAPPPPVTTPPVTPPVTTPPVTSPPETSPPVTDSSPAGPPPSSGTDPSTSAAAPAVLAIAIPPELQGSPAFAGASPLSLAALGTSSIGGVIGAESTQASSTLLVENNAALPSSSLATGFIMVVTSLSSLGPGDDAVARPSGPEEAEEPMTDIGERGAVAAPAQEIGSPIGSDEGGGAHHSPLAPALSPLIRPAAPATPGGSPAEHPPLGTEPGGVSAFPSEPDAGDHRPEMSATSQDELARSDWNPARAFILGFTGLAVGAYARCRRLAIRADRPGKGLRPARPSLIRRRPLQGVGMGRVDA
jgi:hypothetical protein